MSSARSMTGYARVTKPLAQGQVAVAVKSVNHRGLDVHVHLPVELEGLDNAVRAAVKKRVRRGHLQVQVRIWGEKAGPAVAVNQALLESYLAAFRAAAAAHVLAGEPDLNAALRVPGMFECGEVETDPATEAAVLEALEEALAALDEARRREGEEIAAEMRGRNRLIREGVARMEALRREAVPALQARLRERLEELLAGAALDPQRLAQEAAFLADRSDVSEELMRLKVHSAQLEELLEAGEEIGKKVDFLLQEMQREANTVLAKAAVAAGPGLAITDLALAAKSEIERIREQAGNLE